MRSILSITQFECRRMLVLRQQTEPNACQNCRSIPIHFTDIYLDSPKIEAVSSRNWQSLWGGTKKTWVVALFAETMSLSLLVAACLGRKPTAAYCIHRNMIIGKFPESTPSYQKITERELIGWQTRCRKSSNQSRWPRDRNNRYIFIYTNFSLHPNSKRKHKWAHSNRFH